MARSLSPSPERRRAENPRKRERSGSPSGLKKQKKSRKSHRRSRSPRREHKERYKSTDKRERADSPAKPEEGELPTEKPLENGQDDVRDISTPSKDDVSNKETHGRSKSSERRRSKSREKHRSKSIERRRSRSKEKRRRSRSREKLRRSASRERDRRHRSRSRDSKRVLSKDGPTAGDTNNHVERPPSRAPENGVADTGIDKKAKAQPISMDEFLKKKREEEEALAKPKFLSKKEREAMALQRLKEQADAKKQQSESSKAHHPFGSSNILAERRHEAERRAEEGRQRLKDEREKDKEGREREKELELIKKQYLGSEKVKKKIRKPSEKFHLNFDWEVTDDTSKDLNPIYNNTHEARPLFGTGRRAGVDVQEQKTKAAEHRNQLQKKARLAQGFEETEEDRKRDRERRRQASLYDAQANKNVVKEHWSNKSREEMTERDWRIFREDFNISYKGVNVSGGALPYRSWDEAPLPEELMKAIRDLGYKKPSPIQMASIPLGLMQRDVIGVAETGSGKTAAFVLPMLCYIKRLPVMTEEIAAQGPYAVIMAPVRELAQQIEEEAMKLAKHTPYRTVSVVGGQEISEQAFKLRKGCEIVVATPGRMKDCLDQSYAVLNQCNYVVLDEADRMIDMGFEPQVVAVLEAMPSSNLKPEGEDGILEEDRVYRTTYMFSATMPPPVERLARKFMRQAAVINIGSAGKATDNVTQKVYMIKDNEKLGHLEIELNQVSEKRSIVFVNTKKSCDIVSRRLDELGYACTVLHGSKTQDQREASLAGFREEKYNVLVATDVAGRGIDVPDVALVINYDMPNAIDHYTHRIGRTARAGRSGTAVTFLTPQDTDMYYELRKFLEDSKASIPAQLLHHEAAKRPPDADKSKRETTIYARK